MTQSAIVLQRAFLRLVAAQFLDRVRRQHVTLPGHVFQLLQHGHRPAGDLRQLAESK